MASQYLQHLTVWNFTLSIVGMISVAVLSTGLYWQLPLFQRNENINVSFTLVRNAADKGAVCLDGSPPAYHLHRGSGKSARNWLVHLEGGGWCSSHQSCGRRSRTPLGSSDYMDAVPFEGILSDSAVANPDFYNWNRVKVRYCDGASYSGNVEGPVKVNIGEQEEFYERHGQRVWMAIIEDLLKNGMNNTEKALLSGCSAGGLGAILHCDEFQRLLPAGVYVKCLSDAGFFLDAKDVMGAYSFRNFYKDVVQLQHPQNCSTSECFFPQYLLPSNKVPMFLLNPGYDVWQIENILVPRGVDSEWRACSLNFRMCSESQFQILREFRKNLLNAMKFVEEKKEWGMFINSCFTHCQSEKNVSWNGAKIGNKTLRESVGDWYFNRQNATKSIDCDYPCNPTCLHWNGWS